MGRPPKHEYPYDAKRRVQALIKTMRTLVVKDPEQEVQGLALPVFDAARRTLDVAPDARCKCKTSIHQVRANCGQPIPSLDTRCMRRHNCGVKRDWRGCSRFRHASLPALGRSRDVSRAPEAEHPGVTWHHETHVSPSGRWF